MKRLDKGVTLVELLVVLMILSLILTAAIKTWDVTLERGRFEQTRQKFDRLSKAITGDPDYVIGGVRADFGFVGDMGCLPRTLADLANQPNWVTPPESSRWRGPYVKAPFAESPEAYRIDGWGDSIVYNQDSLFLRSYGGGGLVTPSRWLTRSLGYTRNDLLANTVDGWVVDQRGEPPPDSVAPRVIVQLEYPRNGVLFRDTTSIRPGTNGAFDFIGVPQGVHTLRAMFWSYYPPPPRCDTVVKVLTVLPRVGARGIEVRMNVDWNNP
ncbi:prepilin-type N-terminal cleavage/methylation domain-containing protein [candidate division WOR-3 bacterium]|jgi:prepilin-type N-terminal cleavage/methylation domain-containing protein|nr:prepilin-type N-terminal cleavage/methylation domain-containing protein [candidate division WOR-3 bacterium]